MAAAAAADAATAKKAGPSLVVQIAVLLVLSGAAAGAGLLTGNMLGAGSGSTETVSEEHGETAGKGHDKAAPSPAEADLKRGLVQLSPVMTNLSAPADTWIRLELTAVFDGEPDLTIADAVHQDVIAYIRTVKLHQMEGASGFQHLKEDLNERAAMRSGGRVKQLLVRAMLIE